MKRAIVFLVILFALTATCSAQWSVKAMADYYSQYIYVNGQNGHPKPVQQLDLSASHVSGAYLGIWASLPYDGSDSYGREVDLTAGYAWMRYDVGVMYFANKPLNATKSDAAYPYAKALLTKSTWRSCSAEFFAELDYVASMDGSENNGFLVQTYGKYAACLTGRTSQTGKVGLMYDGGVFNRDPVALAFFQGDLQWKVNGKLTLRAPTVKAFLPLGEADIETDAAVGLGLTYTL